jgi:hypothetical protein
MYQMDIKYTNNFIARPSKIYPNLDFWFENIPSGNPDTEWVLLQSDKNYVSCCIVILTFKKQQILDLAGVFRSRLQMVETLRSAPVTNSKFFRLFSSASQANKKVLFDSLFIAYNGKNDVQTFCFGPTVRGPS